MGIMVSDSGPEREPYPLGTIRAICVNIFDLGLQSFKGDAPKDKLALLFELEHKGLDGKRMTISRTYTKNIGEKSALGKDLISWRSAPFTDEERKNFDLDRVKGKPCQINIVPKADGSGQQIGAILPPHKEMINGKPRITIHWAPETPSDYCPPFIQKMIDEQVRRPARAQRQPGDDFIDDIPGDSGDVF